MKSNKDSFLATFVTAFVTTFGLVVLVSVQEPLWFRTSLSLLLFGSGLMVLADNMKNSRGKKLFLIGAGMALIGSLIAITNYPTEVQVHRAGEKSPASFI